VLRPGAAGPEALQPLEDLAVVVLGEEAQGDDEEDHEGMGQTTAASLGVSRLSEDLLNDSHGDDTFQSKKSFLARQLVQLPQVMDHVAHGNLRVRIWTGNPILAGGSLFV
jgi:hypothetical protein